MLPQARVLSAVKACLASRQHVFGADYAVLYVAGGPDHDVAIFVDSGQRLATLDRALLEVFVANVAACFRNVSLVERLLHAQAEIEAQHRFLGTVIDANPHFVYVVDRQRQIRLANQSLAESFGLTVEQLVGHALPAFAADPALLRTLHEDDQAIFGGHGERIEREFSWLDAGGEERWLQIIKAPIRNADGEIEQLIAVGIETSTRKRAELALFEAKERALVTLHSIGDAVITTDASARVDYLNPVAEALTGWSMADAVGRPVKEVFRIVNDETRHLVRDPVQDCLQAGRIVSLPSRSVLLRRDGREYDVDDSAAPICGREGQILGAVLVFHDVTQTRQLTRQLAHQASHDALTGLINRPEFERRLARALAGSHRHGARHVLCFLDLDRFKVVNDTAGHAAGDELLRQINSILTGMFRERDTLARIGGDEFALLQENCPLDRAYAIAESVVRNIREHRFIWQGRSYQIGVSVGLVAVTPEAKDIAQLLAQADLACYTAKELGRNRVHVYRHADTTAIVEPDGEILGAAGLRDALEQELFQLHYQPIVALHGERRLQPVRYEALLRVAQPVKSPRRQQLVLPAAFMPAAERYGLMGAVDRWVVRAAFRDFAQGIAKAGAGLAINLSANSLGDEHFLDFIESQFVEHSLPPEKLCFEITETAAMQHLRPALALLGALKRHGCQLALDDFGSALSSFHNLRTLPLDFLKIEGGFVQEMLDQPRDLALVAAINDMSHALAIETVAEFVGSQATAERLGDLGVDYAQGFYFGKPAPWVTAS